VCLRFEPAELRDQYLIDALNAEIVDEVNRSGTAFVSHAVIDDGYVIRVSIGNIHTTRADVERLWRCLTEIAGRRLAAVKGQRTA
jgi:aromatic-L-amino-acid decarboxylase